MKLYSMSGAGTAPIFPLEMTIILNTASSLITNLTSLTENNEAKAKRIAKQIYFLSLISQRALSGDEMKSFLADSYGILEDL